MLKSLDFRSFCNAICARATKLVLLCALLLSSAHAITVDDLRKLPWEGAAVAALGLALVVIALTYAMSKIFSVHEFEAWAKNELWQVFGMAILVIVVWNIAWLEEAAFAIAGEEVANPIEFGKIHLARIQSFITIRLAELTVFGEAFGAFLGPLERKHTIGPATINPLPMVRQYEFIIRSQIVGTLFSALGGAATITVAQRYFLDFVVPLMLTIVLPAGIVLRSIPFFRWIGSALIAIALGLYFVYPLTLVLAERCIAHLRGEDWYKFEITPRWLRDFLATGGAPAYGLVAGTFRTPGVTLLITAPLTFHTINLLYEHAAFAIVVLGAVLPFLSVVITFGVTRELAALLGADIELSTLLRIL